MIITTKQLGYLIEFMSFKLESHPGILLKDHLYMVMENGLNQFKQNCFYPEQELPFKVALLLHDFGKASTYFQAYLHKTGMKSKLSAHSELSALWAYFYLHYHLAMNIQISAFVYLIIRYHHGNFANLKTMLGGTLSVDDLLLISGSIDYAEMQLIYKPYLNDEFVFTHEQFAIFLAEYGKKPLSVLVRILGKALDSHSWTKLNYLYSLLIWADKHNAIFHSQKTVISSGYWQDSFVDDYVATLPKQTNSISKVRNAVYQELSEGLNPEKRIYSIHIPTGAGKTLSSIHTALKLKQLDTAIQRIIYCLPFTSIIDQNYKVLSEVYSFSGGEVTSDALLPHHHLSDLVYRKEDDEYSPNEAAYLIETWESELIVTTFVQLLMTFLTSNNSSLKRFHKLSNSIIILDEVQTIPHKYWLLLHDVFLRLAEELNIYIFLVTATMPLMFDEQRNEIVELAKSKSSCFNLMTRVDVNLTEIRNEMKVPVFAEKLLMDIADNTDKNILIILNTIKSSLQLYEILSETINPERLIYLSANIIPKHRLEKIDKIKHNPHSGYVIVSTQVVEAGVDIDLDIVYRDLAPLDAIFQSCGRCNRNQTQAIGIVNIIQLCDDRKPYWKYIYDDVLIFATLKALLPDKRSFIKEPEFLQTAELYYQNLKEITSNDNSCYLLEQISYLNYESAFVYNKENSRAFHLFDDLPVKTVFLEIDDTASELLVAYRSPDDSTMSEYESKAHFQGIVRKMAPYMINVPARLVSSGDAIFIIEKAMLSMHYDIDTGYKREPKIEDYIF